MLVVKNLRKSLFNDDFQTRSTQQIYLLNDFFKLELLLSTMASSNICSFLIELFQDLKEFLNAYNVLVYNLYRFNCFKSDPFYENLQRIVFLQKGATCQDIIDVLKKIFVSINIQALGEIGAKAFLGFLLKYEEFLRELNKFTSWFPDVPNELVFNLVNEYISYFKMKALKIFSPDFISENWSVLRVEGHHFRDKIVAYLQMEQKALKYSSLFKAQLQDFRQKRLQKLFNFSLKQSDKFVFDDQSFVCSLP